MSGPRVTGDIFKVISSEIKVTEFFSKNALSWQTAGGALIRWFANEGHLVYSA